MITNKTLRFLLGIEQFAALWGAWRAENQKEFPVRLNSIAIFFAVTVAMLPAIAYTYRDYFRSIDQVSIAVGIATCLAILFRTNSKIPFLSVYSWKESLRHTHTAFALGCIPLIVVLLIAPEMLYPVAKEAQRVRGVSVHQVSHYENILFILKVSVWAGVTEEFIYRGMLVSAIRRWTGLRTQLQRDVFAILLSALIFGFSHFSTWGPGMSFVLAGLGTGFAIAYIAVREVLLTVIVYHIIFDILSLTASLYLPL